MTDARRRLRITCLRRIVQSQNVGSPITLLSVFPLLRSRRQGSQDLPCPRISRRQPSTECQLRICCTTRHQACATRNRLEGWPKAPLLDSRFLHHRILHSTAGCFTRRRLTPDSITMDHLRPDTSTLPSCGHRLVLINKTCWPVSSPDSADLRGRSDCQAEPDSPPVNISERRFSHPVICGGEAIPQTIQVFANVHSPHVQCVRHWHS